MSSLGRPNMSTPYYNHIMIPPNAGLNRIRNMMPQLPIRPPAHCIKEQPSLLNNLLPTNIPPNPLYFNKSKFISNNGSPSFNHGGHLKLVSNYRHNYMEAAAAAVVKNCKSQKRVNPKINKHDQNYHSDLNYPIKSNKQVDNNRMLNKNCATVESTRHLSHHQYNIIVPEIAGKNSASESGQFKRVFKKVTFSDESSVTTNDPKYNYDLRKSDQQASLPLTKEELKQLENLNYRMSLLTKQWEGCDPTDPILEDMLYRFGVMQKENRCVSNGFINSSQPVCGLKDFGRGRYPGLFTLPLVTELNLCFGREMLIERMTHALWRFNESDLDNIEVNPPQFLINSGVFPDCHAWNVRRNEAKNLTSTMENNSSLSSKGMAKSMSTARDGVIIAKASEKAYRPITKKIQFVREQQSNVLEIKTPTNHLITRKVSANSSPDSGLESSLGSFNISSNQ